MPLPVHSAQFAQPGPALNPMGLKLPGPIRIEVTPAGPSPKAKWYAREKSSQRPIREALPAATAYEMRYNVAALYEQQVSPWAVDMVPDPTAALYHLHHDEREPSLCGSRFHQLDAGAGLAVSLPEIRTGREQVPDTTKLCPICYKLFDRSPHEGDLVRDRLSKEEGTIVGLPQEQNHKAGKSYLVSFESGTRQVKVGEFSLVMMETLPNF